MHLYLYVLDLELSLFPACGQQHRSRPGNPGWSCGGQRGGNNTGAATERLDTICIYLLCFFITFPRNIAFSVCLWGGRWMAGHGQGKDIGIDVLSLARFAAMMCSSVLPASSYRGRLTPCQSPSVHSWQLGNECVAPFMASGLLMNWGL